MVLQLVILDTGARLLEHFEDLFHSPMKTFPKLSLIMAMLLEHLLSMKQVK